MKSVRLSAAQPGGSGNVFSMLMHPSKIATVREAKPDHVWCVAGLLFWANGDLDPPTPRYFSTFSRIALLTD